MGHNVCWIINIYGGYSDVLISENRELKMTWKSRFPKFKKIGNIRDVTYRIFSINSPGELFFQPFLGMGN
uniref:Uncharacterized protein n=1 Tax=Meloidogyne enterolobii TaxID=390850 RepID=A0A6V7XIS8_MELEN|nr:unnamed protein product [Meloidogyne enterolobii]